MAVALVGTAWPPSPCDMPYGVQWSFMIGTSSADMGGGSRVDVTSDGTVFVQNRTGVSTWASNVRGGLGAITPPGQMLYGTTVASLPTMLSPGQNYAAGVRVSAAGNKAYFTIYGGQSQYWEGGDGKTADSHP